jgi:hypothetical protein
MREALRFTLFGAAILLGLAALFLATTWGIITMGELR